MNKIKILIVEDDREWLEGLSNFLRAESDLEIVGIASSRSGAVKILTTAFVDIILLDINLNGNLLDGIDAINELKKYSSAKIIMLTSFNDKEIILAAFESGASHYVLKRNFTTLPQEIRNVIKNSSPMQILSNEYVSLKQKSQLSQLTASEFEIFKLLSKGYSHSQVEIMLNKSSNTIRNQISSILKKLGVKNCKEVSKKYGTSSDIDTL